MDAALYGTRAEPADAVIVLSHQNTKRFTTQVGRDLRGNGPQVLVVGGIGWPDVDIETTEQEQSSAFTASQSGV
jgi:hypothetical protein